MVNVDEESRFRSQQERQEFGLGRDDDPTQMVATQVQVGELGRVQDGDRIQPVATQTQGGEPGQGRDGDRRELVVVKEQFGELGERAKVDQPVIVDPVPLQRQVGEAGGVLQALHVGDLRMGGRIQAFVVGVQQTGEAGHLAAGDGGAGALAQLRFNHSPQSVIGDVHSSAGSSEVDRTRLGFE